MRHDQALQPQVCLPRFHRLYLCQRRSVLRLHAILTILILSIGSQAALAYKLDKTLFLGYVEQRMQQTRTQGLSGAYFSIADIPHFIRTVDQYLNGVYIDSAYLSALASTDVWSYAKSFFVNLRPDQGYTQGKDGDANKHPSEKDQFDGSIILVNIDALGQSTAMHEAIHAFAFARRLGDLDMDDYNGPEFIAGGLVELLVNLHRLDKDVEGLIKKARSGGGIEADRTKLFKHLAIIEGQYKTESDKMKQLLHAMGGKADFKGYRQAIAQSLDAVAPSGSGTTRPASMKIRDYCPSAPKKFSGEKAFSDEKCPNGVRRYRLVPKR